MTTTKTQCAGKPHTLLRCGWILLWELPQNLLGLLVYLVYKSKTGKTEFRNHRAFIPVNGFGISLGWFIFYPGLNVSVEKNRTVSMKHEFGHAIQSHWFGPLYLPIVGIPSLARYYYGRYYFHKFGKSWHSYYKGYPEQWANKLGEKYF